jgi:hypothetical protein
MSWARRRQAFIAFLIVLVFGSLTVLGWYVFVYEPASCSDGLQNQDELGVDCDGTCARMCVVPRVDALWTRAVKSADGVYHGVALVKNPLPNGSGTRLSYTLSLYDAKNILVAERRGVFDLAPGETRVLFEPNMITRERTPVRAATSVDGGVWQRDSVLEQRIRVIQGVVDSEAKTYTVTLENLTAEPIYNVIADALLYDARGIVVTASESKVPLLAAHGRHEVVYTWSEAFDRPVTTADTVVRIDVQP